MSINPNTCFVKLESITVKKLKDLNPQLLCIYTGKTGITPIYTPTALCKTGSSVKNIFEKIPKKEKALRQQWIGKIGDPRWISNDPNSKRSRDEKGMGVDCIREKIASDLYQDLGRGHFKVPKTRLSRQDVMNGFTEWNYQASHKNYAQFVTKCLRIMSCFVEGYHDLGDALLMQGVSWMEFVQAHKHAPEMIVSPEGASIPLIGLKAIALFDQIPLDEKGVIWVQKTEKQEERSKTFIDKAQLVSIDPMTHTIVGLQDLRAAKTKDERNKEISFMEFIAKYRKFPEIILTPLSGLPVSLNCTDKLPPITEILQSTQLPLHFIWVQDSVEYIEGAQVVKRLPGTEIAEGFQYLHQTKYNFSFMDYIKHYHRPPEEILNPQGALVPLKGFMSLMAVARALADIDVLGGAGLNIGFVWVTNALGSITEAELVKIDPGYCFSFDENNEGNWVIDQKKGRRVTASFTHLKDLQTATGSDNILQWEKLTPSQQQEFIAALFNCTRFIHSTQVFDFFFQREGLFHRSVLEQMPEVESKALQEGLKNWVKQQEVIYAHELKAFKNSHSQQLLQIHYLDQGGDLMLPIAEEALPIYELYTSLKIIKTEKYEKKPTVHRKEILSEMNSFGEDYQDPATFTNSSIGSDRRDKVAADSSLDEFSREGNVQVAARLWKNSEANLTEEMIEKVKIVTTYLEERGFELCGVPADGDCFLHAFLGSYQTFTRKIPLIEEEKDKIQYLRDWIAKKFLDENPNNSERANTIKRKKEWINSDEGDLLALVFTDFPIRIVTIQTDKNDEGIIDMVTRRGSQGIERKQWEKFQKDDYQPKKIIFIVDLGGHFVYAKKKATFTNSSRVVSSAALPQLPKPKEVIKTAQDPNQLKTDAIVNTWTSLRAGTKTIELSDLFQPQEGRMSRKVLILGRAGIGKSTLCQKMAYDWASGHLWTTDFAAVYWIPLRRINGLKLSSQDSTVWMAEMISHVTLRGEVDLDVIVKDVQQHRQKSLWILDGYDEASPELQAVVIKLMQEEDLTILLTSRPELTEGKSSIANELHACIDFCVENIGFSEDQIETYIKRFFSLKSLQDKDLSTHSLQIPSYDSNSSNTPRQLKPSVDRGGKSQDEARSFLKMLHARPELAGIATVPLLLQILCSLWEKKKEPQQMAILGVIYKAMDEQLRDWYDKKWKGKNAPYPFEALQKIAQDLAIEGAKIPDQLLTTQDIENVLKRRTIGFDDLVAAGALSGPHKVSDLIQDGYFRGPIDANVQYLYTFFLKDDRQLRKWYDTKWQGVKNPLYAFSDMTEILEKVQLLEKVKNELSHTPPLYPRESIEKVLQEVRGKYVQLNDLIEAVILKKSTEQNRYLFSQMSFKEYKSVQSRQALDKIEENKKVSYLTEIYQEIVDQLLNWNAKKPQSSSAMLPEAYRSRVLEILGDLAGLGLITKQLVIPRALIESTLKEGIELGDLLATGLIKEVTEGGSYEFLHLSFQQYLTASHLIMQPFDQVKAFITKHREDSSYELTLAFVCGLLYQKDPNLIPIFFKCLYPTPLHSLGSLTFVQAKVYFKRAMRCLNESPGYQEKTPALDPIWAQYPHILKNLSLEEILSLYTQTHALKYLYTQEPSLVYTEGEGGILPFHWICYVGNIELAQWLVSQDFSLLSKTRNDGWTPLHLTVQNGQIEMTKWLVSQDRSLLRKVTNSGVTPFHLAAYGGHLEVAQWLVSQDRSLLSEARYDGRTSLHLAVENGHLEMTKWLVSQDRSLMKKAAHDCVTPFHLATYGGHLEVAQWLVSQESSLPYQARNDSWASLHPFFVNPEPITLKGLKNYNPQITYIYNGKSGTEPQYTPFAETLRGASIKNIYQKASKHSHLVKKWIGKIGNPLGILRNERYSIRTRSKIEMGIDCMREKLASDLYQELGRGLFQVPKTRISLQPLINNFTQLHALAAYWSSMGITHSLRIMSRFIDGYQDLREAKTLDNQELISVMEFIRLYQRPPQTIVTPAGTSVPLKGFMSLLAVARLLADIDVLGGNGSSAGFIWIKNETRDITGAQIVKIDPGFSFSFDGNQANWVIAAQKGLYAYLLSDLRDLQTSTMNKDTRIQWKHLNPAQQQEFLATLLNSTRYLKSKEVIHFLFHREGLFNRSELEQMPTYFLEEVQSQLHAWVMDQLTIYAEDLKQFKEQHFEQLLRIQYIDNWGELFLSMADETFPIRELYTSLKIVKKETQGKTTKTRSEENFSGMSAWGRFHPHPDPHETDSSIDSGMSLRAGIQQIELADLFQPHEGRVPLKILLLGRTGIGKSTLCQKMAHDWASGRLWSHEFQAVYWIPLRALNQQEWRFKDSSDFLAEVVSHLILKNEVGMDVILKQIRQGRNKSLWILDGYDEISSQLQTLVAQLLQEKDLTIILTSRPGMTETLEGCIDLCVENIGFSEAHIQAYAEQFFSRKAAKNDYHPFLKMLQSHKNLFEIAHIPLQLQMLCSIWEQGRFDSLTGVYQKMVEQLLQWNAKKPTFSSPSPLLPVLGKVAEAGMMSQQLILSQEKTEGVLQSTQVTVGGLVATGLLKSAEGSSYKFLHLSFQEYLSASHAADLPLDELKRFILQHSDDPSYHLTLVFLCGLLYQRDASQVSLFFATLYKSPLTLTPDQGKSYFKLSLRCLNECPGYQEDTPALDQALVQYSSALESLSPEEARLLYAQTHTLKYLYTKWPSLVHKEDKKGNLPFNWICYVGNSEIAKWLVSQDFSLLSKIRNDGGTPLHSVAETGQLELAKWLISQDSSLLSRADKYGGTPLHMAAQNGRIEIVKWLCSTDPKQAIVKNANGETAYKIAINKNQTEVARWLRMHYLTGIKKLETGMIEYNSYEVGINILPSIATTTTTTTTGIAPTMTATTTTNTSLITTTTTVSASQSSIPWLRTNDPHLLSTTDDGWTPLHAAAQQGDFEAVQWLCTHDHSLLNTVDKDGWTPLHVAVFNGDLKIAQKVYTENPGQLEKGDHKGNTPLHLAAQNGYLEMAQWLYAQRPSPLYQPNKEGNVPLHLAALNGHLEVAKWLYSQDPKQAVAKNRTGATPYKLALHNRHTELATWLQSNDSNIGKNEENCITS